jgi:hypothetical protein
MLDFVSIGSTDDERAPALDKALTGECCRLQQLSPAATGTQRPSLADVKPAGNSGMT